MFARNPISVTGEQSVPLLLGLAAYCTLADSFGGLKGRCGSRQTLAGLSVVSCNPRAEGNCLFVFCVHVVQPQ